MPAEMLSGAPRGDPVVPPGSHMAMDVCRRTLFSRSQSMPVRSNELEEMASGLGFTLKKVAKTPHMMRVRRGSHYMLRKLNVEGAEAEEEEVVSPSIGIDERPALQDDLDLPECLSGGASPDQRILGRSSELLSSGWCSLSSSLQASMSSPMPELDESNFHMVTPPAKCRRGSGELAHLEEGEEPMELGT
eukprot:2882906-Pyramimonas_sp.AAC.1